ncbi:hypothetical protein ACIBKY_04540 [Nonomuraea sp. NPDC050394]|uniref:hypothetical protein n=1 Tax=Nonomuraea sp. NPDC050394 TaxID=3364363 RepID=UPI0037A6C4B7
MGADVPLRADRCLLWNERHLRHALGAYENFYNRHRSHQALTAHTVDQDQAGPMAVDLVVHAGIS